MVMVQPGGSDIAVLCHAVLCHAMLCRACCAGSLHGLMSRSMFRRRLLPSMTHWYFPIFIVGQGHMVSYYQVQADHAQIWTSDCTSMFHFTDCLVCTINCSLACFGAFLFPMLSRGLFQFSVHYQRKAMRELFLLQLTRKRYTDGEFQQVGNSERNFWWRWLHGQDRNQAQQKAAEAALARAQAAEVSAMNRFDVLAQSSDEVQTTYICIVLLPVQQSAWQGVTHANRKSISPCCHLSCVQQQPAMQLAGRPKGI